MALDPLLALLAPFHADPGAAGVFTDFDGTLAPIVEDPWGAVALPGVTELLGELAARYHRVAVVSGRPIGYLIDHLGDVPGLVLRGLYGLEGHGPDGDWAHPDGQSWCPAVEAEADRAEEEAPPGVHIERKGLSFTFHYRTAPDQAAWAASFAKASAERSGLVVHTGRMAYELLPPIDVDKGRTVEQLSAGLKAACFLGDDRGDLSALVALDRLAARGLATMKVVVNSPEVPAELLERADVQVDGPEGAVEVLRALLP